MMMKKYGLPMTVIMILAAVMLSSCTLSLTTPPAATPTLLTPSGAFASPISNDGSSINDIETLAAQGLTQTALAGTPTTPQPIVVTGTLVTPLPGEGTPIDIVPAATTAVPSTVQPVNTPDGPTPTTGPKPATYTLQAGEFPYCIARRFNVNPDELLSINGLTDGQVYYPNLTLKIPQTGNVFPADRALQAHPTTYTVGSANETLYSIACKYGDVDPSAIAAANGIAVSAKLTVGQKLNIP
ncbi:MAG: LysM peptidoglycan-binding domain-containing protein [Chloroflexota bacterium]